MRALLSLAGTLVLSLAAFATPTFTVLNPPSNGSAEGVGIAAAISRDGSSLMVPGSWTNGDGTMLYNKSGWHLLQNLTGNSISGDGTRLVGNYSVQDNYFFWDGSTYIIPGTIYGGTLYGLAANGTYSVGCSVVYNFDTGIQEEYATLYTPGIAGFRYFNHPTGREHSYDTAWACSADGTHVVGWSYKDDTFDGLIPVEWLYGSALNLPLISGATYGAALAINDQGNMLFAAEGGHLVLYTNGVPQDLGANQTTGGLGAETSMSNDGNVFVFHGLAMKYPSAYVVWTPQFGFIDAYQFLLDRGVNFGAYKIFNVYSVSADGTKFGGLVWDSTGERLLPFIATIDPLVPAAKSFSINPSIVGGNNLNGVIGLTVASKGRFRAVISSADHLVSAVPVLNANTTVEDFLVPTSGVAVKTAVPVEATIGGTTLTQTVDLTPATFTSMNFAAGSVVGGANMLCAAHFNGNTPTTGGTLTVKSSNPEVAVVNASYALAKNYPYSEFTIVTKPVTTVQKPVITITYGGVSKSETLIVNPKP